MADSSLSFDQRQMKRNLGEELFEEWAMENGHDAVRFGFDEKRRPVNEFHKVSPFIRNLPDYDLILSDGRRSLIAVKGTDNFKLEEFEMIPMMTAVYSSKPLPLTYAFCFTGRAPIFKTPQQLIDLFHSIDEVKYFESDKKPYKCLGLK